MVKKEVTVVNKTGLHARPASMLTQMCKKYPETIRLVKDGKETDPKSIVALLAAGIKSGSMIEVQVTGDNEEQVCTEIVDFISSLTD